MIGNDSHAFAQARMIRISLLNAEAFDAFAEDVLKVDKSLL